MANQNYKNSMIEQRARMEADKANRRMTPMPPRGNFIQGRLMGAPTNQPTQSRVPMGFSTYDEAGIPEDQRKILDDAMAKMQLDIAARDVEQQNMKKAGAFTIGGTPDKPIYGSMAGPVYADGTFVDATNQQAQNYQNFLQQGIQRSNTMNQGAMTDFANMEPGMQATQPATATTPKPAMPVAGMGMQKSNTTPRKFSTVNTPSARFG